MTRVVQMGSQGFPHYPGISLCKELFFKAGSLFFRFPELPFYSLPANFPETCNPSRPVKLAPFKAFIQNRATCQQIPTHDGKGASLCLPIRTLL